MGNLSSVENQDRVVALNSGYLPPMLLLLAWPDKSVAAGGVGDIKTAIISFWVIDRMSSETVTDTAQRTFPREHILRFGVNEVTIASETFAAQIRELMRYEAGSTRQMIAKGMSFDDMIDCDFPLNLEIFSCSSLEILNHIVQQNYDVLRTRPLTSRSRTAALSLRTLTGKLLGRNLALAAGRPAV